MKHESISVKFAMRQRLRTSCPPAVPFVALALLLGGCSSTVTHTSPVPATSTGEATEVEQSSTVAPSTPSGDAPPPSSSIPVTPTGFSAEQAYDACLDFIEDQTVATGGDPSRQSWGPFTADQVTPDGDSWAVVLTGTVTDDAGNAWESVRQCRVSGSPGSPDIVEPTGL